MKYWLYYFFKITLFFPYRIIYRRVYIDGLENIPKDKPVLICSNHPNSFLDGVCYECFLRRQVFTLVRGDVFRKPLANRLLRSMLLLPIFRPRDVKASEARIGNSKTLEDCLKLFRKNKAILIFSEGDAYPEKRVRTIKNGTLKLAIDCYNHSNQELDLYIIPAGINYQKLHGVGGAIHFAFGQPMRLKDYQEEISENSTHFVTNKNSFLKEGIGDLVVHAEGDKKIERNLLQEIFLNELLEFPLLTIKNAKANQIAKNIEKVMKDEKLVETVRNYNENLSRLKISDKVISNSSFDFFAFFIALITFAKSLPFFLVNFLAQFITRKLVPQKIKNVVFRDSIVLGISLIFFLLSSVGFFVYYIYIEGIKWGILYWIFSVIGGYMWFRVWWDLPLLTQMIKRLFISKNDLQEIISQRNQIINATK